MLNLMLLECMFLFAKMFMFLLLMYAWAQGYTCGFIYVIELPIWRSFSSVCVCVCVQTHVHVCAGVCVWGGGGVVSLNSFVRNLGYEGFVNVAVQACALWKQTHWQSTFKLMAYINFCLYFSYVLGDIWYTSTAHNAVSFVKVSAVQS
jgi:hypothetical protein